MSFLLSGNLLWRVVKEPPERGTLHRKVHQVIVDRMDTGLNVAHLR